MPHTTTPGDWTIQQTESPSPLRQKRRVVIMGAAVEVAEVNARLENWQANAALIAAAPKLLEALTQIASWPFTSTDAAGGMVQIARTAIKPR